MPEVYSITRFLQHNQFPENFSSHLFMNPAREFRKSEPCVFFEGDYRYGFGCTCTPCPADTLLPKLVTNLISLHITELVHLASLPRHSRQSRSASAQGLSLRLS